MHSRSNKQIINTITKIAITFLFINSLIIGLKYFGLRGSTIKSTLNHLPNLELTIYPTCFSFLLSTRYKISPFFALKVYSLIKQLIRLSIRILTRHYQKLSSFPCVANRNLIEFVSLDFALTSNFYRKLQKFIYLMSVRSC